MSSFSTSDLTIIASLVVLVGSALTLLGSLLKDARKDIRELTAKMFDQVIPTLTTVAEGQKTMVEAAQEILRVVAIQDDRRSRDGDRGGGRSS
jgi:phage-related protein